MLKKYILIFYFMSAVFCKCQKPFKTCRVDDSECQRKEAEKTLAHFVIGNKGCKIPPIIPMVVPKVEIDGPGLSLKFNEMKVYGLERGKYKDIRINPKEKTIYVQVLIDNGSLIGPYHLKGNLGPIVIDGQDNANITAINVLFNWTATYEVKEKHGKQYGNIIDSNIVFDMDLVIFQFDNVVTGNDQLSQATNKALNADWRSVVVELAPGVGKIISSIFKLGLGNIMEYIPLDEIFTV
ncbi:unnamed protein product [Brassicogethes aeneus]|uniref:Uncharacterized protein n=1 Tax=Brassicogethes aeneus TaxID=1431903 RepID=A0A9P0FFZ4_BRAAE|nr:unnamed protein product [Brassicogethes aeneus]